MSVLALIPARGGSKGVPRKNVKLLGGKPLIAWTIEAARACPLIDRVMVSTDDPEIADAARTAGADIPFMRPADLASDTATTVDVVLHAIDSAPATKWIVLLQPTSPLRNTADISAALDLARTRDVPSVVSVVPTPSHPQWMYQLDDEARMHPLLPAAPAQRRQDLPTVYALNGAIYVTEADWFRQHRAFVGPETLAYPMPVSRSVDIDDMADWAEAEYYLSAGDARVVPG